MTYQEARAKILWRVHDLGWSGSEFKDIERRVDSGRHHSRSTRAKVERYGKKYSWIAYYELAGELDRLGKLKKWHKRFDADIDPFFPEPVKAIKKAAPRFLGDANESKYEWINAGKIPCIEKITTKNNDSEQPISWVLLKGITNEESKRLDRNFYCSINLFFTKIQNAENPKDYFNEHNNIDWPEQQQTTYVFSGEIYENTTNELDVDQFVKVKVGTEFREVEVPEIKFDKDGFRVGELKKKIVEQPVYKEISIRYPLIGYYWESTGKQSLSTRFDLLAPWLVETLSLDFCPVTLSYFDQDGQEATKLVKEIGEEPSNNQELFYLREDLFEKILKKDEFIAGYHIYGERHLARTEDFITENERAAYKQFETSILVE